VHQRGTSKREDILNTSILLKPAATGKKGECVLQFTKARGFPAPDPFAVRLSLEDGECRLERSDADLSAEVAALLAQGLTQKAIAERIGKNRGNRQPDQAPDFTTGPTGSRAGPTN
jgi:hypothetical protein